MSALNVPSNTPRDLFVQRSMTGSEIDQKKGQCIVTVMCHKKGQWAVIVMHDGYV
jgi:hypothetical protein